MRGLMVLQTVVVAQLQSIEGRRRPFRSAEADPHGPGFSADHRDSPVAVRYQVVDALVVHVLLDMPVVVQRQVLMVQTIQNCLEVPQVQFLRGCGVAVLMQRQVPGSPGTRFRSVHRQVRDGLKWAFCLIFEAFFALRPAGREGQGGGDARSLLPGVLPPQLGAFVMGYGQTHLINTQVRTTTTRAVSAEASGGAVSLLGCVSGAARRRRDRGL